MRSTSGDVAKVELADDLPNVDIGALPINPLIRKVIIQGDNHAKPYPSRSEALFAVCCALARAGCDDDTMAAVILNPDYGISISVLEKPNPRNYAGRQIQRARDEVKKSPKSGVQLYDFYAYMPDHSYIFAPTGEIWAPASVNSQIQPMTPIDAAGKSLVDDNKKPRNQSATAWLDKNRHVEQMTWCPGRAQIGC